MEMSEALERLRRSPLREPVRLAVMLLLAARHSMEFEEMRRLLGVTPGNLWSHLERLRGDGLVRTRYAPRLRGGPRLVVEVTDEGLRELLSYMEALRVLEAAGGAQ